MITKQYFDLMSENMLNQQLTIIKDLDGDITYTLTDSAYKCMRLYTGMAAFTTGTRSSGICVGSDGTPAQFTDYKLGSKLTGLSASVAVTRSHDKQAGCSALTSVVTITNNNSSEVTIREIGVQMEYNSQSDFLLERTVLDEPLTLPAGGIGKITYTVSLAYPQG